MINRIGSKVCRCMLNNTTSSSSLPPIRQVLYNYFNGNHNIQRHNFSSRIKIKAACPYRTLNIPKDATYKQAKKSFLIIAMKHHPDTVGDDCEVTQKKSQDIFMRCRKALESLEECDDTGKCILKSEAEVKRSMSNEEFDDWFKEETGHNNPFAFDLDPAVMREVAGKSTCVLFYDVDTCLRYGVSAIRLLHLI